MVFTDLDGTLLDHHSYSADAAAAAMAALKARRIPIVFTSSKTLAELRAWQLKLGVAGPVIFENGAGIALDAEGDGGASESLQRFSPPYEDIVAVLHGLRRERGYAFQGFADWDDATVAEHTGLPPGDAAMARQRLGSEPLIWHGRDEQIAQLMTELAGHGLRMVRGGRFWHVLGEQADKARAMRWLKAQAESAPRTVALGDSPNDAGMLAEADIAVVVRDHKGDHLALDHPHLIQTEGHGPVGWQAAMSRIIKEHIDG